MKKIWFFLIFIILVYNPIFAINDQIDHDQTDSIKNIIDAVDVHKIRILFESDVLLRSEDKVNYIELAQKKIEELRLNMNKTSLNLQELFMISIGIIGLYAFRESTLWVKFFQKKISQNEKLRKLDIDDDDNSAKILVLMRNLFGLGSILAGPFSLKQIYDGLTKKKRVELYKKANTIAAILKRMPVRKNGVQA